MINNNQQAFFALVRAGLWEKEVRLLPYGKVDYDEVMRLAQEQAVIGLVAAGLEHVADVKIPQVWALRFAGAAIQMEQKNKAMNAFIAEMVEKMQKEEIYTVLVKGQGIAQCYEKPLWRVSGDIDFFLSDDNYQKAKTYLTPFSSSGKPERRYSKEIGFSINQWLIELHGTMHTGLSSHLDKSIDEVQKAVFFDGRVRSWMDGQTKVFLPGVDEDVFFVFTHFIKHFYKEGGVTLRQMCDWCRLLYTYRESLNHGLLAFRIKKAGLMDEWRAFAEVAVKYLGMPVEAMPMYDSRLMGQDSRFARKTEMIIHYILKGGEWRKWRDTLRVSRIFPWNTLRFTPGILLNVNWMKAKDRLVNG